VLGAEAHRYERHRPEQTLLHRLVEQYYPAFVAALAAEGREVPGDRWAVGEEGRGDAGECPHRRGARMRKAEGQLSGGRRVRTWPVALVGAWGP
jgi:hypothetical protein